MKRLIILILFLLLVLSSSSLAEPQIKCSVEENFVQYYVTGNWTNPGIYNVEGRITKHIQADGEVKYWLHVNARGRNDGFTTKAQIAIGDKEYSLKCVDVISSLYRFSMSSKSRLNLTQIHEFYDIGSNVINEISSTSKPVYIVVNFKNRANVRLPAEDSFFDGLKVLPSMNYQDREKYLKTSQDN